MLKPPHLTNKEDFPYVSGLPWDLKNLVVELKKHSNLYPKSNGQPVPIDQYLPAALSWRAKVDHLINLWARLINRRTEL